MIRILVFGDVFGKNGRRLMREHLPRLREEYHPDCIIANSENITNGVGPKMEHAEEMRALGIDCLTGGNHSFANIDSIGPYMDAPDSIQIRPLNLFEGRFYRVPGRGYRIVEHDRWSVLITNLLSGVFLPDAVDNPFLRVDTLLEGFEREGRKFDAIVVDFHRETTAEIACLGNFLDGRVSLVYGTHTHIQTNDDRILPRGTGFMTDVGMTGTLESSLGHNYSAHVPYYLSGVRAFRARAEPEVGAGVVTAVCADIEDGKCTRIQKIRIVET